MGIQMSSMPGGMTPHCDRCGVALCWDISFYDYLQAKRFWDNWECKTCNPAYKERERV